MSRVREFGKALQKILQHRLNKVKEQMAAGMTMENYRQAVGQAKAYLDTIMDIDKQLEGWGEEEDDG